MSALRAGPTGRLAVGLSSLSLLVLAGVPTRAAANAAASPVAGVVAPRPRLVVVLMVDQLRRDRLDPKLPGGLGRLAREGRVFTRALVDHALSETCPGHVTALTGRHPGPIGVPGNHFLDPTTGERVYCVADDRPEAAGLDGGPGRSPRNIRATALGDWLRASGPGHHVFSVSGKDRAAIAMGGRRPDGVWWMTSRGGPAFTSSRYYAEALPAWVERFNGSEGPFARLPERWTHDPAIDASAERGDDFPGESDAHSNVSPHPIRGDTPEETAENLRVTPYLDELTLDFARELVMHEGLTRASGAPHLLLVSLSANDYIGHAYGPFSRESQDALRRLDRALGRFLAELEVEVGPRGLLVALSADHGVLPLPEWLAARGELECPVEGGRISATGLFLRVLWALTVKFGPWYWPAHDWIQFAGPELRIDRARLAERGASLGDVVGVVERELEARPGIEAVWTRDEILHGRSALARLYRNSFDPERSGDMILQLARGCLAGFSDEGTTHGSPYDYDRAVPLVFMGPGIPAGRVDGPAATLDLAPTLAHRMGIPYPGEVEGRVLPLSPPEGTTDARGPKR